jgi:hypothetical protein
MNVHQCVFHMRENSDINAYLIIHVILNVVQQKVRWDFLKLHNLESKISLVLILWILA